MTTQNNNTNPTVSVSAPDYSNVSTTEYRMFTTMSANEWMRQAAERPDPVPLWFNLWYEDEVACLFADTNVGKSIYAIQIADHISRNRKVLYFDFEMSDKQFQLRYTADDGTIHSFDPRFHRVEFSRSGCVSLNMQHIIDQIEMEVDSLDCRVVIVDNISWICNNAESGDAAGELMQLLIDLKRRKNLSILVLAHTPKRAINSQLTQNSLAGSKRIANFLDSIFAIGVSRDNPASGRYIKQIKTRSSELVYGEDNVITAELVKRGDFISIEHTGNSSEHELLRDYDDDATTSAADSDDATLREYVMLLLAEGKTQREICSELHISPNTISKIKRECKAA